jgi:CHAT domain-containing protein/Tfp pilus assembly protein PilF
MMRSHFSRLISTILFLCLVFPIQILEFQPGTSNAVTQNQDRLKKEAAEKLFTEGMQQAEKKDYQAALIAYQKALAIYREIGDRENEGDVLRFMGEAYFYQDNYPQALEFYRQALEVHQKVPNYKRGIGNDLNNLGMIYQAQSKYGEALKFYQQSLDIRRETSDREGEGQSLNNFGVIYLAQGRYPDALKVYEEARQIFTNLGKKKEEAIALDNIGVVLTELGQYGRARENYYDRALKIRKAIDDRSGVGTSLQNIGFSYTQQAMTLPKATLDLAKTRRQNYAKARKLYNQALVIFQNIRDREGEALTLNNLGFVQTHLGEHPQALKSLEQALAIFKELGDRDNEGDTLDTIGTVYKNQYQYEQALKAYQQALTIQRDREIGNRPSERVTLSNIGDLFRQRGEIELAIAFYKRSVNITEATRRDLKKLSIEEQGVYKQVVADTYRALADLLLQQNRVMEALEVLDLLKVQDLQDYLKNVKGNDKTAKGIELRLQEKKLENIKLTELLSNPEAKKSIEELRQIAADQNRDKLLPSYLELKGRVQKLGHNSALFYPLILDNRLELVLFIPNSPPFHCPVKFDNIKTDFVKKITNFREELSNKKMRPSAYPFLLADAQELYKFLIEPIEDKLRQAKIQTIIYAPDGELRHIPIAALYDGKQWLTQRFRINYITAIGLTDPKSRSQSQPLIMAGAYTQGDIKLKVNDTEISMEEIPSAKKEVEGIAKKFTGTPPPLIDKNFNHKAINPENMKSYDIVHLATHGKFVSGQPEDSFILLADKQRITLREIENWKLPHLDLMVLSACETALGDGIEIIGFGYQLQVAKAKAAIATLWEISDKSTSKLMDAFYTELQKDPGIPKAEALQRAQIRLINNKDLYHPHLWAPFILIGNGL